MTLIIILLVLLALLSCLLLLRLRLRCYLSDSERRLFIGLGRTGADIDWKSGFGQIRVFDLPVRRFALEKRAEAEKPEAERKTKKIEAVSKKVIAKTHRKRSVKNIAGVLKHSLTPIWRWTVRIVRGFKIEQLEGRITGGFESPDLTGQAYGYYCALMGAVPALSGRFNYHPDWEERSFQADFKASVALPVYTLVGRTVQLVWGLPLRKIIKLAIGTKEAKGKQDVQQRC